MGNRGQGEAAKFEGATAEPEPVRVRILAERRKEEDQARRSGESSGHGAAQRRERKEMGARRARKRMRETAERAERISARQIFLREKLRQGRDKAFGQ